MNQNEKDELIKAARAAREHAYAPYSKFRVGAAVRANGKIYAGANVENASYGLSLCAERAAIAAAVVGGAKKIDSVAVVTQSSPPVPPCGMCRQTIAEFAGDVPIVLANDKEVSETSLAQLLPQAFRKDSLP